jgi:hypothetical protein
MYTTTDGATEPSVYPYEMPSAPKSCQLETPEAGPDKASIPIVAELSRGRHLTGRTGARDRKHDGSSRAGACGVFRVPLSP